MDNFNTMGSLVQKGYKCKPVEKNKNKPIMYYKNHILICSGERCQSTDNTDIDTASHLRDLLKQMQLCKGKSRIKVTQALCFGACRFGKVAVIYTNNRSINFVNNGIWLRNIENLDDKTWQAIFKSLSMDEPINSLLGDEQLVPIEELDEN